MLFENKKKDDNNNFKINLVKKKEMDDIDI